MLGRGKDTYTHIHTHRREGVTLRPPTPLLDGMELQASTARGLIISGRPYMFTLHIMLS